MTPTGKIRDLIHPRYNEILDYGVAWRAKFAHDVPDFHDMAYVIILDFDDELKWGPCPWQSKDAATLPTKDDDCIVMFDNRRTLWVIAWWPY